MLKINGEIFENHPAGVENLNELMMGEIHSTDFGGLKTPLKVYGNSVDEILGFAKNIAEANGYYDMVDIYDILEGEDRDYLFTREIK